MMFTEKLNSWNQIGLFSLSWRLCDTWSCFLSLFLLQLELFCLWFRAWPLLFDLITVHVSLSTLKSPGMPLKLGMPTFHLCGTGDELMSGKFDHARLVTKSQDGSFLEWLLLLVKHFVSCCDQEDFLNIFVSFGHCICEVKKVHANDHNILLVGSFHEIKSEK